MDTWVKNGGKIDMDDQIYPSTKAVGFWSAVLATVFSITYVVGQVAVVQPLGDPGDLAAAHSLGSSYC